ncbi:MAG: hypothetical protein Q7U04_15350 [Bacteriovorax sp.]|nr:hypothetical protein [Bacteriovorax sp.]
MTEILTYGLWDIPENFCDIRPITQYTISNFIGREETVQRCKNAITSSDTVIVLEGDVGVGKTSIGNYVRFSLDKVMSPRDEYKARAGQTPEDFLMNLVQTLVQEVYLPGSKYSSFKDVKPFKELSEIFKSGVLTNLTLMNFGLQQSRTAPVEITSTHLLGWIREIVLAVKNRFGNSGRLLFQINNLDLNETFTEEQMIKFFNEIRDYLQIEGTSWILTGTPGIFNIVSKVKRIDQIISVKESIQPFSTKEMLNALDLRIKNAGDRFKQTPIPIEKSLLEFICLTSEGVFRKVINNIKILLDNIPAKLSGTFINEKEVTEVFYRTDAKRILNLFEKYTNYEIILTAVMEKPGLTQDEIVAKTKIKQSMISAEIKRIQEKASDVIFVKKISVTNNYYLTTRTHFAVKGICQTKQIIKN